MDGAGTASPLPLEGQSDTGLAVRAPRVALVHEWFTALAGSEKVVEQFCGLYPDADLFAVFADPDVVAATDWLRDRRLTTTFIQHLPLSAQRFRNYLLLMPMAVEQLDVSAFDVVISSSHAVAKGVLTGPDQQHISYVHSPIRYAWDLQHQYLREANLDRGVKGWVAKWMLHQMRIWDTRTAPGLRPLSRQSLDAPRLSRGRDGRASVRRRATGCQRGATLRGMFCVWVVR